VKSSTATGTTATADRRAPYRGRFAPSPTGALHQGSLLAALASWLDARAHRGTWLIRMEDLDAPRCVAGMDAGILHTLERFGFVSDEPVMRQSGRHEIYRAALQQLAARGLAYRCDCSRSELTGAYTGHCRDRTVTAADAAWRLRMPDEVIVFEDRIQGTCRYDPAALGDPVIFRRDGLAAYQLAVVVDDAAQRITDVVRGADLLESTAWQLAIARALGLPEPRYAHIPLLLEPDGSKLSKSRRSVALEGLDMSKSLQGALLVLQMTPPQQLKAATVSDMLGWAVQHWVVSPLAGLLTATLPNDGASAEGSSKTKVGQQGVPHPNEGS
jgi:glutamyl-Q tRNA(Asp) synthetase